jgi:enamine deaminase RidA (YjgF/YER057c/UK114 family)
VVKVLGVVASSDDFHEQHLVMNGCSDVLGAVFGPDVGGTHARSAIGTNALPFGVAVEVEAIVRIKPAARL